MNTSKAGKKPAKKGLFKVIFSAFFGNALEFYDFTLYGVFATTIGQIFFPTSEPILSIISSWGTFAAGFLMRPIGAFVFGQMGDSRGRKFALGMTIILMGVPTLMIGLVPGYCQIGIAAPMILIFCRLIQGFSTGGEYNGAVIFAIEHATGRKPGFISGIILSSCVVGALLATFAGYCVNQHPEVTGLWRIPFIFGACLSFFGFVIRYFVSESPEFAAAKKVMPQVAVSAFSWKSLYKEYGLECLVTFLLGSFSGSLNYILFGFVNIYLTKFMNFPVSLAFQFNIVGLLCYMVVSPIAGYSVDIFGSRRFIVHVTLLSAVLSYPIFILLQSGQNSQVLAGEILLAALGALLAGPSLSYVQNLFPAAVRYRAISLNYSLGLAVFGGSSPVILISLLHITSWFYVPTTYIAVLSCATLVGMFLLNRKECEFNIKASHKCSVQ